MADGQDLLLHPAAVLLVRYRQLVRGAFSGAALYGLIVGLATLLGGDDRFWGPSYKSAMDMAESIGASPSVLWGVSVMVFGALGLIPIRKVALCGLYGVAAWSAVFAISFLVSINQHPLAGMSGVAAHGFIAIIMTGLIVVRIVDPKI